MAMKKHVGRAVIEVGFIIFLFYSNLPMGEFERSGLGKKGLALAVADVFTSANFEIAAVAALLRCFRIPSKTILSKYFLDCWTQKEQQ